MGKETKTTVSVDGTAALSTVLLEGTDIISRGGHRARWNVKDMRGLKVSGGKLSFATESGKVSIELGDQAPKWLDALQNPRTRVQKLGIEADSKVCVLGAPRSEDISDIEQFTSVTKRASKEVDVVLLFTQSADDLEKLEAIVKSMSETCSVWVLWPKGLKGYGHEQAAAAGKAAGLSQTRSVGFSEVYSGLRFVRSKAK